MSKGLLAKWIPRQTMMINGKNFTGNLRNYLNLTPKNYRKKIVGLSNTVETLMCEKKWRDIVYSHVPSCSMNKYRKAFLRNDESRFTQFIEKVKTGEEKIQAGVLFPYQLYQAHQRNEDKDAIEA